MTNGRHQLHSTMVAHNARQIYAIQGQRNLAAPHDGWKDVASSVPGAWWIRPHAPLLRKCRWSTEICAMRALSGMK